MATKAGMPSCKLEDIPTIGEFVLDQATIDLLELTEAASNINQQFLEGLRAQSIVVRKLVKPFEMTSELKKITSDLYGTIDSLKPTLNKLEIKIDQVVGQLSGTKADFGLVKLRKMIRKKNAEGVSSCIEVLLRQVDTNKDLLGTVGFKEEMRMEIEKTNQAIIIKNQAQNKKINERGELTQNNQVIIIAYWKGIKTLMKAGRLLYSDNKAKKKEYTYTILLGRIEIKRIKELTPAAPKVAAKGTSGSGEAYYEHG